MIKHLLTLLIIVCFCLSYKAQQYGNEWINYNQKHYKIAIPETGIYRINYNALQNAGVPVTSINPQNFQLFNKGDEQYILVNGETDGIFNSNDYIEFYAEKNDGKFDSLAYTGINQHPNPYVPLFNDTNYVFLTWNNSTNNKRVIIETDVNFSGYTATSYITQEKIFTSKSNYSSGPVPFSGVYDPRYTVAEGFGQEINTSTTTFQTPIVLEKLYQSASTNINISAGISGNSAHFIGANDHRFTLDYLNNNSSYTTTIDTTYYGFNQFRFSRIIPSSLFSNNANFIFKTIAIAGLPASGNKNNIHFLRVLYPRLPDLNSLSELTFYVDNNPTLPKTFLDFQNVQIGSNSIIFYDLSSHRYISTVASGSNVKVLIPNSFGLKKCILTTSANIKTVTQLQPVNQNGYFVNYKSNNPDSTFVIVTNKSLQYSAGEYYNYRQSSLGGNNNVILSYVEELYDQFAYGNVKNPIAIKNFCRFLIDSLPQPPKYLLLFGKSITNEQTRINSTFWNSNLVPTMGRPSSDNLYTSGLKGLNSSVPFIPTGRISAKNDNEAIYFLNKVKAHESPVNGINSPQQNDWRKHILHFAGGTEINQQTQFKNYLAAYENIIEDTLFGGNVYTFSKTTTAPIQITVSDSVTQLMNYGAAMVTFFGHGSVTGFDQAIDNPEAYNNKDKYPLFIANSCYSGDIHRIESISASEKFVLANEKGSISFIASSSTGVDYPLHSFSTELYKGIAYEKYNYGIGDAIKNSCLKNAISGFQLMDITNLEMTLEGDPSVKINGFSKPDYEIKNSYVSFNTSKSIDSIGISIIIKNLGRAVRDTFIVKTTRYYPSGDSTIILKKIKAPFFADTINFNVLKDFTNGIGLNNFKVNIDYYNEIGELLENNNSTGNLNLFINGGDVIPVYPYKYAIVPKVNQITLKASTADPFAPSANYKLQLDTNDTFTNPINSSIITSNGGVIEWTVNLPLADSTVYFWRITKDSVSSSDRISWRESSFQVITGKRGWAQAHFHQFKNDRFQFINYQKPQRKFEFYNNLLSLLCTNEYKSSDLYGIKYVLNGSILSNYNFNLNDGWSIAVFDSVSAKAWTSITYTPNTFASPHNNCLAFDNENRASFDFGPNSFCGPNPNWQTTLENFLNFVPVNNYILAYSSNTHKASTYSASLYQAFKNFGGYSLNAIGDSVPVIIFGKKRSNPFPGCGHEVIGNFATSKISLSDTIKTKWDNGYIESELIGPSTKWRSLHWKYQSLSGLNDSIVLKVIRYNQVGVADTVPGISLTSSTFDVYNLDNYIDATNYPYIKLIALVKDNISHIAPQMKKWQVIYDDAPECALNPKKGFSINKSTLQEGENIIVNVPIENIGELSFNDSLVVNYWVTDKANVIHPLAQKLKQNNFSPTQIITDTINLNTLNLPGQNYLWIDVNQPNNSRYQLEQYHFNNIARISFSVNTDKINPLLDVTFDGSHILNGDIVSSKPNVLISLKDENKFLALNDTSNFAIFVRYPNQSTEKRLFFAKNLLFYPAQLPSNSCKIEWKPEGLEDGKYKLIVQATDRSKNVSGSVDYNIEFEVINKQTVTEVLNYPNPFSTSTRFVFTLTGSEVPDVFTIQIMTITGKVVREITKDELGNLHIGRNISQYAWDGKDEFGDKLANGVYLYKVITRHNGKEVEKNKTDADSFFKKGFGKLVIMR